MPRVLTAQQVRQYRDEGFLSPVDVMSEEEAIGYRMRFEEAERKYPDQACPENRNNAHLSFVCLDELAHHKVILDVVEDLIGENISFWASVLFIKEPSTPHYVSWHQDGTYMAMNSNEFVTPWLALSPSNLRTGCMSMIPGSHRDQIQEHRDTFAEDNILTRGQEVAEVDESLAVDLILKPGQMSLHHGQVIHGSRPNLSSQRRIGFAMQSYMPLDVRQTYGRNLWMHMRGERRTDADTEYQRRPKYDMDPVALADRSAASDNLDKILYKGAAQKGRY